MSEQSPRFRQVLDNVAGYTPGKAPTPSGGKTFKLSSNESPYDPLPSVAAVIADAGRHVNRYPDSAAAALTQAIADRFGVPAAHVAVGCGSVGIAQQLLEAVGEPGAEVIYAWRSFEAYPYLSDLANPSGMFMSEQDLPGRLKEYDGEHVILKRIALTRDQLTELPSFPAADKRKDPRYQWFIRNYGRECWELDALDPNVLRDCVRKHIEENIGDREAWERCKVTERAEEASLRSVIKNWTPGKQSWGLLL